MNAASPTHEVIRFGDFALSPASRVLQEGSRTVRLGSRALEILILLLENAGRFVSKDEILQKVWPTTVVIEGNLRVHIAGLRKALGDGQDGRRYIVTAPNKGYLFAAPLQRESVTHGAHAPSGLLAGPRLPMLLTRLIGQEVATEGVSRQLISYRLVSLIGTGGIGKTSLALSVANGLAGHVICRDGVFFVDLASIATPDMAASAVAAALGLASVGDNLQSSMIDFLHERTLLLVLDNCEHMVSAVAFLVEQLLRGAPGIRILTTSREPLRAQGEWVHRLQPLRLPPVGAGLDVSHAMRFAGIELFVERACAARDGFRLIDSDIDVVTTICRRLDGIPLAIELAAARVGAIGLRPVAAALDHSLSLLSQGRRTAIARHQTLTATIDWSFQLLTPLEQRVLLRLSVFAGVFTLESASAVANLDSLGTDALLEAVLDLVDKSLITADVSSEDAFFRLLETTRSYALEGLLLSEEEATVRRRHAAHCLELLIQAETDWTSMPVDRWLSTYGRRIDDVRAALAWAFSDAGDRSLCVALAAKSALLFFQLSLADEYRRIAERSMAFVEGLGGIHPRWEFELNVVYGHMLYHTVGLPPERERALARSRDLAEQIGDRQLQALACSTNWMAAYQTAHPQLMLEYAQRYEDLTEGVLDPSWTHMYDRMKAPAFHFLGDQAAARACCERGLSINGIVRPPFVSGSQINLRVSMGTILARVLWIQGDTVQAEAIAQKTIDAAVHEGESVALAFLLGIAACPVALWNGQIDLARQRVDMLLDHTRKHALKSWHNYAVAFNTVLEWQEAGSESVHRELELPGTPTPPLIELLATLHPRLVTQEVIHRAHAGLSGWCRAEIFRVQGLQALSSDTAQAEAHFRRALDIALLEATPAWALRAATSLGELLLQQGRHAEAWPLLTQNLGPYAQGLQTPDVQAAIAVRDLAAQHIHSGEAA